MKKSWRTVWVHFLGNLESVRVGEVAVGRGDGQDERVLASDELHEHVSDLVLNVRRLVPHWHLGQPRQVNQGEIEHWRGERLYPSFS